MTTHLHIYSSENGKIDNGECVNDMVEGFLNILWRCEKEEKEKVGGGGGGGVDKTRKCMWPCAFVCYVQFNHFYVT